MGRPFPLLESPASPPGIKREAPAGGTAGAERGNTRASSAGGRQLPGLAKGKGPQGAGSGWRSASVPCWGKASGASFRPPLARKTPAHRAVKGATATRPMEPMMV